jgi:hypothetical protein
MGNSRRTMMVVKYLHPVDMQYDGHGMASSCQDTKNHNNCCPE